MVWQAHVVEPEAKIRIVIFIVATELLKRPQLPASGISAFRSRSRIEVIVSRGIKEPVQGNCIAGLIATHVAGNAFVDISNRGNGVLSLASVGRVEVIARGMREAIKRHGVRARKPRGGRRRFDQASDSFGLIADVRNCEIPFGEVGRVEVITTAAEVLPVKRHEVARRRWIDIAGNALITVPEIRDRIVTLRFAHGVEVIAAGVQ